MKGFTKGKLPGQGINHNTSVWLVCAERGAEEFEMWLEKQAGQGRGDPGRVLQAHPKRDEEGDTIEAFCPKGSYTGSYRLTATVRMLVLCFTENPNSTH